ncbi:MAG: type I restriction-modification system subunit M [Peptostreptococcaceae bacterium]
MMNSKIKEHQQELHTKLWAISNDLRGNMDASEFKSYILGLIFFRYLSEKVENRANNILSEDNVSFEDAFLDEELRVFLIEDLTNEIGYVIEPKYLFSSLIKEIENSNFDIEKLQQSINHVVSSTIGASSEEDFDHLFDDMDLTSSRLGKDVKSRSRLISKVMMNISQIDFMLDDSEIDVLGDAYEYLISQFAATAGKKAGEFYTPQQVSKILSKIVTNNKTDLKSVYDPTCGSGSLLLRVAKEANVRKFYGQELTSTTYNLARMNMILHNINYSNFDIKNDNTLENPEHLGLKFEAIVANPPYSANWSADPKFLDDERFDNYGKLAPKSKADFAFIQHMIHHLDENGTMAVVLPHGVLFRGAGEGLIRKHLIEKLNVLDCVIGLPSNIFYGTSIPTAILVFKKNRTNNDILFIDASNEFEKGKNQNNLTDDHVQKIVDIYNKRITKEKFSYLCEMNEIIENDYNLNIPRYVDTFEEEEEIDLDLVKSEIDSLDKQIQEIDDTISKYLKELGVK